MRGFWWILLLSVSAVECIVFMYFSVDANDPVNVSLLREALMNVGLDPTGLVVLSMYQKLEVVRTSYKATFLLNGRKCFLKWRVNMIGTQAPAMPTCDSTAIGDGYAGRYPKVYPAANPPVYRPVYPPVIVQPPVVYGQPPCYTGICLASQNTPLQQQQQQLQQQQQQQQRQHHGWRGIGLRQLPPFLPAQGAWPVVQTPKSWTSPATVLGQPIRPPIALRPVPTQQKWTVPASNQAEERQFGKPTKTSQERQQPAKKDDEPAWTP